MSLDVEKFSKYTQQIATTETYKAKYSARVFDVFVLMFLFFGMKVLNYNINLYPIVGLSYMILVTGLSKLVSFSSRLLEDKIANEMGISKMPTIRNTDVDKKNTDSLH